MSMQTGEQFQNDLRIGKTATGGVAADLAGTGRQLLPADELRALTDDRMVVHHHDLGGGAGRIDRCDPAARHVRAGPRGGTLPTVP